MVFLKKKKSSPPQKKIFFLPFFYTTLQCGRYGVFKKNLNFFLGPEKVKKQASKVAHNRPRPLYFTVQPRPTANSPELILHIKKSRDQTSVLLSVVISLAPSFSNIVYLSRRSTLIFPFLFYILKLQKILNWFFHGESPLIEVVFWIENVVVYSTWT